MRSCTNFAKHIRSPAMALIDSVPAFKKRCDELADGLYEKLDAQNITSFSTMAFSIGSPQNQVNDIDMSNLATSAFGGEGTLGQLAVLRRLHFESCTLLIADMKSQTQSVEPGEPSRKLPFVEKQSRLEAQKTRISGLLHTADQQPAHSLIDTVFNIDG